jgi:hypothetical protein
MNIVIIISLYILFSIVIYLFIKINNEVVDIKDRNLNTNQQPNNQNTNNLLNYYNKEYIDNNIYKKNDIDNNFSTKTYVDNNIQNSITSLATDQNGNIYRLCGNQELGYDIEIDDTITFNHPIAFKENVNFVEPTNFNNQVDFNNPVDFNGLVYFNGDVEVRNNLNIDHSKLINTLPRGSIIAWYSIEVPNGWALCNGLNGTPDLSGRFILGAGQGTDLSNRTIGLRGGEENVTLTTRNIPAHKHDYTYTTANAKTWGGGVIKSGNSMWGEGDNTVEAETQQQHSHSIDSHNNMPPFHVLTYIMKL